MLTKLLFTSLVGFTTIVGTCAIPSAHRVYPIEYHFKVDKIQLERHACATYCTHTSLFPEWIHWANENYVLLAFSAFLHCKSYFHQPFPGADKKAAPWCHIGVKGAAFVGGIIMLLPALPSLIMGLTIRAFEHGYRPFLSYYVNPDVQGGSLPALTQDNPLHIGALNVSLTPSSVNIEMDMRPALERAEELARSLIEDPSRPTILFIEEGWNEEALRHLCERLKSIYPHIIHSVAPHLLGMSSGIGLFSLYPFENVEYVRFGQMIFSHRLPARGILKVSVRTACGEPLYIYGGIHTQSMEGYDYCQARLYQIRQLAKLVADDAARERCMQAVIGDFNVSVVDLHGFDNRGQAEQQALDMLHTYFNDPFLKDHDLETGTRTTGSPYFLEDDNRRMGVHLPEPSASWYDGPFSSAADIAATEQELDADAKRHGFPSRQLLPGKAITGSPVWGTPAWFAQQSAMRARYDYALFPKQNSTLGGRVEYRRLVMPPQSQSPASDHLLLSFLIWRHNLG